VDKATWRYGGNTPCLEFSAPGGTRFILDCGTGLRMLGNNWSQMHPGHAIEAHFGAGHDIGDQPRGIEQPGDSRLRSQPRAVPG
jgi:hypothetical protein